MNIKLVFKLSPISTEQHTYHTTYTHTTNPFVLAGLLPCQKSSIVWDTAVPNQKRFSLAKDWTTIGEHCMEVCTHEAYLNQN